MEIVGGTYRELCREPRWDQLYGSGLRAAAALASMRPGTRLHTFIGKNDRSSLEAYVENFGLEVSCQESLDTFRFTYAHALARPWIDPPRASGETHKPIDLEGEIVLRFGMLEGDPVVQGRRVIYDPQSPNDPRPFVENGSAAEHLAIVCNRREGQLLTGKGETQAIGESLLESERADVAILKLGSHGVQIFQEDGASTVPAFRTSRVFPIGSGDVFSAIFAHQWGELESDPVLAAETASRCTAWYCATRSLPIPEEALDATIVGSAIQPQPRDGRPRVYLAGPFFTAAERWLVDEARDALSQQGVAVFSPLHDVGIGPAEVVAPKDLEALHQCEAVFAIADHCDPGTVFEVGYARARDIPVIVFVEGESEEALKMMSGSGCEIVNDFVSAIYRAAWAAMER